MFRGLLTGIGLEVRYMARRSAFAAGGAIFMTVGLLFLTGAGWIVLAEMRDAVFASLVCGAAYFGLGLVFLAMSRRAYRASDLRVAAEAGAVAQSGKTRAAVPSMAEAFFVGLNSGMRQPGAGPTRHM